MAIVACIMLTVRHAVAQCLTRFSPLTNLPRIAMTKTEGSTVNG